MKFEGETSKELTPESGAGEEGQEGLREKFKERQELIKEAEFYLEEAKKDYSNRQESLLKILEDEDSGIKPEYKKSRLDKLEIGRTQFEEATNELYRFIEEKMRPEYNIAAMQSLLLELEEKKNNVGSRMNIQKDLEEGIKEVELYEKRY